MVEPPHAENFIEAIRSNETPRPPGSEAAAEINETMATILNLLGKKHTISIIHRLSMGAGPYRFNELEELVNIAPNTLSNRLDELAEFGLVTRTAYNEIPPRVEYEATDKTRDLAPLFWYLAVWTERHELRPIQDEQT